MFQRYIGFEFDRKDFWDFVQPGGALRQPGAPLRQPATLLRQPATSLRQHATSLRQPDATKKTVSSIKGNSFLMIL